MSAQWEVHAASALGEGRHALGSEAIARASPFSEPSSADVADKPRAAGTPVFGLLGGAGGAPPLARRKVNPSPPMAYTSAAESVLRQLLPTTAPTQLR